MNLASELRRLLADNGISESWTGEHVWVCPAGGDGYDPCNCVGDLISDIIVLVSESPNLTSEAVTDYHAEMQRLRAELGR